MCCISYAFHFLFLFSNSEAHFHTFRASSITTREDFCNIHLWGTCANWESANWQSAHPPVTWAPFVVYWLSKFTRRRSIIRSSFCKKTLWFKKYFDFRPYEFSSYKLFRTQRNQWIRMHLFLRIHDFARSVSIVCPRIQVKWTFSHAWNDQWIRTHLLKTAFFISLQASTKAHWHKCAVRNHRP